MTLEIFHQRLRNQKLARPEAMTPGELVAWLGAVQSQDYSGARWALGMRGKGLTDADVERAFDDGKILRTHILRPTWHFVPPADIRWMLSLSAPRVHIVNSHYAKKAELDSRTLARSRTVLERSLGGGRALTRTEIAAALARAAIAAAGQRLAYLIMHAELEQVVCSGPRRGKQFTYMLIDERVPRGRTLDREAALAELTRRYFASHGPATIRDYVWWSGLTVRQAKEGLESIKSTLVRQTIGDRTYWSVGSRPRSRVSTPSVFLFPNYDECLIAYRDRGGFTEEPNQQTIDPASHGPTYFAHHIVIDGQVAGSWRRTPTRGGIHVEAALQRSLTRAEKLALIEEVERLGKFMTTPATLSIH